MRSLLAALLFLVACNASQAKDFTDWRDGDLIFHDSGGSSQTEAIFSATGSRFTHVGIVRLTQNGPVVVEAIGPVQETPLEEFKERGVGGRYAVYRMRHFSPQQAKRVLTAAKRYYGRPYDPFFRLDDERIYCSELIWKAFHAVGLDLGETQRFASLNVGNEAVRALFLKRWRQHPDCKKAEDAQACWAIMQDQRIVTPASLAVDKRVVQVYPENLWDR